MDWFWCSIVAYHKCLFCCCSGSLTSFCVLMLLQLECWCSCSCLFVTIYCCSFLISGRRAVAAAQLQFVLVLMGFAAVLLPIVAASTNQKDGGNNSRSKTIGNVGSNHKKICDITDIHWTTLGLTACSEMVYCQIMISMQLFGEFPEI